MTRAISKSIKSSTPVHTGEQVLVEMIHPRCDRIVPLKPTETSNHHPRILSWVAVCSATLQRLSLSLLAVPTNTHKRARFLLPVPLRS